MLTVEISFAGIAGNPGHCIPCFLHPGRLEMLLTATLGWDAPKNGTFSVSGFSDIKFQNGRSFVCMDLHINCKAHGLFRGLPFHNVFTTKFSNILRRSLMKAPFQGKSIPAYLNDLSCSLIFSVYFDDFKTIDTSKNYWCVEFWSSFLPFSCTCLEKLNRSWLLHFIQNSYIRKATLKLLLQSDGEKRGA